MEVSLYLANVRELMFGFCRLLEGFVECNGE